MEVVRGMTSMESKMKYVCWTIHGEPGVELKFSPCKEMIASASQHSIRFLRLVVKHQEPRLSQISCYQTSNDIEAVEWSPDSKYLLSITSRNYVEVINPNTAELLMYVEESSRIGLKSAFWTPDSQHIIITFKCGVYSDVYSLEGGQFITRCLHDFPLMRFSPDGSYIAFIRFIHSGNHLVLMSTVSWNILWENKMENPYVSGLLWSNDSLMVAVWFHSVDLLIETFELNGQCCPPLKHVGETATFVKSAVFSPCSKLLAVKCQKESIVFLYNMLTWQLAAVLDPQKGAELSADCSVMSDGANTKCQKNVTLSFSACGKFLATLACNKIVVVWSITEDCSVSTLLATDCTIADLKWHPDKAHLAAVDEFSTVRVWKFSQGKSSSCNVSELSFLKLNEGIPVCVEWLGKSLLVTPVESELSKAVVLIKKKKRSYKN